MTSWKAYILCATILPLIRTENNQRGHKLEITTTLNSQQPYGYEDMSEEHKIEVDNRIEPVIFEPQRKIKLSRSTYKVTSYLDFKPYKQSFKQFGQYMGRFLVDLHDPHYISTLYNAGRHEGDPLIRRGAGAKTSQKLPVGSQLTSAGFKISLFNSKKKQLKSIKFTWRLIRNS